MNESCQVAAELYESCHVALDAYWESIHALLLVELGRNELERSELEAAMSRAREVWKKRRAALEDHQRVHGCQVFVIPTQE